MRLTAGRVTALTILGLLAACGQRLPAGREAPNASPATKADENPSDATPSSAPVPDPESTDISLPADAAPPSPVADAAPAPPVARVPYRNRHCDPFNKQPAARRRPTQVPPPLRPLAMVGPFEEFADYCCGPLMETNEDHEYPNCWTDDDFELPMDGPATSAPTTGLIRNARLIAVEGLDVDCRMAIEVAGGWYVQEPGFYCGSSRSKSTWERTIIRFEIVDLLPGGAPEVVLTYRAIQSLVDYDPDNLDEDERDHLQVCGVGKSGVPSCLTEFVIAGRDGQGLAARYDDEGHKLPHRPKIKRKLSYRVEYQADAIRVTDEAGKVVIAGPVVFP